MDITYYPPKVRILSSIIERAICVDSPLESVKEDPNPGRWNAPANTYHDTSL